MKVGELYRYTVASSYEIRYDAICLYLGIEIVRDGGLILENYRFLVEGKEYLIERQTLRHMEKINDC